MWRLSIGHSRKIGRNEGPAGGKNNAEHPVRAFPRGLAYSGDKFDGGAAPAEDGSLIDAQRHGGYPQNRRAAGRASYRAHELTPRRKRWKASFSKPSERGNSMIAIAQAALKEAVRKDLYCYEHRHRAVSGPLGVILYSYFRWTGRRRHGIQRAGDGHDHTDGAAIFLDADLPSDHNLGAGSIAAELETGMIHAVISRPLSRTQYILGKFAGLSVLTVICATILYAALLIGRAFSLVTVTTLSFEQVFMGWLLYLLVPLTVLCPTICGSVRLSGAERTLMIFIYSWQYRRHG